MQKPLKSGRKNVNELVFDLSIVMPASIKKETRKPNYLQDYFVAFLANYLHLKNPIPFSHMKVSYDLFQMQVLSLVLYTLDIVWKRRSNHCF